MPKFDVIVKTRPAYYGYFLVVRRVDEVTISIKKGGGSSAKWARWIYCIIYLVFDFILKIVIRSHK